MAHLSGVPVAHKGPGSRAVEISEECRPRSSALFESAREVTIGLRGKDGGCSAHLRVVKRDELEKVVPKSIHRIHRGDEHPVHPVVVVETITMTFRPAAPRTRPRGT